MSREELLTLLAALIRVHGDNDRLLCSREVFESLADDLKLENYLLSNGDIELRLFENQA